jgi:hypothetical protein
VAAARSKPLLGTENIATGYDPTPDPLANEPMPLDAIRDLLGLARALYVARKEQGATPAELAKIRQAGRCLSAALETVKICRIGSTVYASAWRSAERGAELMGELIGEETPAKPMVSAATRRVRPRTR